MVFQRSLAGGETVYASAEARISGLPGFAENAAGLDWCVVDAGDTLHVHLAPDFSLPAALGAAGKLWDLAASLTGPIDASLSVATGPALDTAAVLVPVGTTAPAEAASLARLPVPALEEGAEAIWDRLAHIARRVQARTREGRILGAAISYRGRGRLIGPISGDLLIRFGVSSWR